jgi:hypothetical protein
MSHARAVQLLSSNEVKSRYLAVIGTNVDVGHKVLQSDIDARLAALSPYAVYTWLWQYEYDDNVRRYVDIFSRCCPRHSIVHSLVCAALKGERGYYLPEHLRGRIHKSLVDLSEQTCISTSYHLDDVLRENIYLEQLTPQMNLKEVHDAIYSVKRNVSSSAKFKKTESSQKSKLSDHLSCVCSTKNKSSSERKKKPE